jgi:hypothetical protein
MSPPLIPRTENLLPNNQLSQFFKSAADVEQNLLIIYFA